MRIDKAILKKIIREEINFLKEAMPPYASPTKDPSTGKTTRVTNDDGTSYWVTPQQARQENAAMLDSFNQDTDPFATTQPIAVPSAPVESTPSPVNPPVQLNPNTPPTGGTVDIPVSDNLDFPTNAELQAREDALGVSKKKQATSATKQTLDMPPLDFTGKKPGIKQKTSPALTAKVKQLQGLIGVTQDGVYGPNTQNAVNAIYKKLAKASGITHQQHRTMEEKVNAELNDINAMLASGGVTLPQGQTGIMKTQESIDHKILKLIKKHLNEAASASATAAMSDQDIVKAIQTKLGIKPDGIYSKGTQRAVTKFFKDRGVPHHGHTNWYDKLREEYAEIVGGQLPPSPNTPPTPKPSVPPAPTPSPLPPFCDVKRRQENPTVVQNAAKLILASVQGLLNGASFSNPATYAANINREIGNIHNLAINGQLSHTYIVEQLTNAGVVPSVAAGQIEAKYKGKAESTVGQLLRGLEINANKCRTALAPPAGRGRQDNLAGMGAGLAERKVIFKKSYIQQVIREEIERVLKKKSN